MQIDSVLRIGAESRGGHAAQNGPVLRFRRPDREALVGSCPCHGP